MAVVATIAKGFDLDYMWRNSAQPRATEYYSSATEAGEPPGRWWGAGAAALGFKTGQVVERSPYDLLFGERKGPDGAQLGRPLQREATAERYRRAHDALLAAELYATSERRAELRIEAAKRARMSPLYMDLTISLSKSISVFHASLAENARLARLAGDIEGEQHWAGLVTEMEDMIWQAVHAGFEYFQREAGYTRTGSHHRRVDGRETGQWREAELVVAHWLQHTSRDGDMQLHVHSQIAHICRTVVDGKWRAPDSLGYHEHVSATGSLVAQHLEEAMTHRFGVSWTAREDGRGFEIAGMPGELLRAFSSRRADIDAATKKLAARFEARYMRAPSQRELGELREAANLRTRKGKEDGAIDWDRLQKAWAARLAGTLGISLASVAPSVSNLRGEKPQDGRPAAQLSHEQLRRTAQMALALAHREASTFSRADLIKHLGRVLPRTGLDPAAAVQLVEDLADRALQCEFSDVACLEAPERVAVPKDLTRADGRSVFQRHGGTRYATQAQLSMEQRLVAQAEARGAPCLSHAQSAQLLGASVAQLDAALLGGAQASWSVSRRLGLDQAAAVHAALTSDARVVVIDAPAGSGKTRVLTEIGRTWTLAGAGRVVGVAPSQSGRNTLAGGVPESYNTAQFLGHLQGERGGRGRIGMDPGDLVLADEASMISLPDLADLVAYVTERGAKLVLASDVHQLQPVENGTGVGLLAARLGYLQLAHPVRFTAEWERQASLRLRGGDATVLTEYDSHGRIIGGPPEQIIERAAQRYVALTLAGTDVLLMACDHARRRELCRRVRGELIYLGLVSDGPSVAIADGQRASVGDLIMCTRNDHATEAGEAGRTLANGDLLRIERVTPAGPIVHRALDADPVTGKRRWTKLAFLYRGYADAELGYAITDHTAQSRTVHTGLQLFTGTETCQQAYVGMSRGTHANTAMVFTTPPQPADPRQRPRPAPELARSEYLEADRSGRPLVAQLHAYAHDAIGVLAGVLARDGASLSALETVEQGLTEADSLSILYAQWQAVTAHARARTWHALTMQLLPAAYRAELGHKSRWLWLTLRTAELAGLDPAEVLATAIRERDLTGARDVAAVIDSRIRRRIAGMVPLPQPQWSDQRVPVVSAEVARYIADLAAAMDARAERLGEKVAESRQTWAASALGPVPADPLDRLTWQHKAASIAAYRELSGFSHPADPIGPEPATSDPDLRAAWHVAFTCLSPADAVDLRGLPDVELHLIRSGYRAETEWAPRYVATALRCARVAADQADAEAIRRAALAIANARHDEHKAADDNARLAASYRSMAAAYRSSEVILAATHSDREEWRMITEQPRRLAVAADVELRRRHQGKNLEPLRSAEPEPVSGTDLTKLGLPLAGQPAELSRWLSELTAEHVAFADTLLQQKAGTARSERDINLAAWHITTPWPDAILQPPKPSIASPGRGHELTVRTAEPEYEPEAGLW